MSYYNGHSLTSASQYPPIVNNFIRRVLYPVNLLVASETAFLSHYLQISFLELLFEQFVKAFQLFAQMIFAKSTKRLFRLESTDSDAIQLLYILDQIRFIKSINIKNSKTYSINLKSKKYFHSTKKNPSQNHLQISNFLRPCKYPIFINCFVNFKSNHSHKFNSMTSRSRDSVSEYNNSTTTLQSRYSDLSTQNAYINDFINSFKDFCVFKTTINRREIYELLNDKKIETILKRKVSIQCISQPKICLSLNMREFLKPKKSARSIIGKVSEHNSVVTIDLEDDYQPSVVSFSGSSYSKLEEPQALPIVKVLSSIRSSFAYKVEFLGDYNEILVKTVTGINFIELNVLELSYCNLSTIEPLNQLYAPNLRVFNFQFNCLTDIRVIKKLQTSKIKYVSAKNYEPKNCPFPEMYELRRHFPVISKEIVKGKYESSYYNNRTLWKEHFRKLMRLFEAMSIDEPEKKRKY